jgi:hypothetical protein
MLARRALLKFSSTSKLAMPSPDPVGVAAVIQSTAVALVQVQPTGAVTCTLRRPPSAPISSDSGLTL